jgi:Flp pilus assembly protein TadG
LVETVIMLPIVLLILFGIIEFASAFNDSGLVTDAARAGGRIASTVPKTDFTSANTPNVVSNAVASAAKSLPAGSPKELWIYKANDKGYPGSAGNTGFATCPSGTCTKYTWNTSANTWAYSSGSWPATAQNGCGASADQIGIYVKAKHDFVTGLFGASVDLTDSAVFRFEPLTNC